MCTRVLCGGRAPWWGARPGLRNGKRPRPPRLSASLELRDLVFVSLSIIGGRPLADALKADAHAIVVSQVVPHPRVRTLKVIREFQKHLQDYDTKAVPSFNNLEGYIAARVLVEGLKRVGRDLSREKFVSEMESMDVDLGDYRIVYTPENRNGSDFVQITMIIGSEGGFTY